MGNRLHTALAALLSGVAGSLLASCAPPQQPQPVVTSVKPQARSVKAAKAVNPSDPYGFDSGNYPLVNGGTSGRSGAGAASGSNSGSSAGSRGGY